MKNNSIFFTAIILSLLIHLFFLKMDSDMFKTDEAGIMIPVTLVPENVMKEKAPESKKSQIEPQLAQKKGDGVFLRRGSISELTARYTSLVIDEIGKRKFSPDESRYYRLIGNVRVGFTIGPYGRFSNIRIVNSSGDELLDKTALNAVRETDGVVKRPVWSGRNILRIFAIIKYQYKL